MAILSNTAGHCIFVLWFLSSFFFFLGGWWRWALISLNRDAPSRTLSVSASVNLPLHHEVQKFSSGIGSPGWSRKRAVKQLWCVSSTTSKIINLIKLCIKLKTSSFTCSKDMKVTSYQFQKFTGVVRGHSRSSEIFIIR